MTIKLYELTGKDEDIMFGPFCWRSRMSVLHKGLDFELVPWYFTDKSGTEDAGFTTVPTMDDNGVWKSDSLEIAQYLDEAYPDKPALIDGEAELAQFQLVNAVINSNVFAAAVPAAVMQVHNLLREECQTYFRQTREDALGKTLEEIHGEPEEAKANLAKSLSIFDATFENTPYLGGNKPNYSDYTLFGILKWVDIVSTYDPISHDTPTGQWFARISDLYDGDAAKVKTVRS